MPFSGSGNWSNVYNWNQDAAAGIRILSSRQQAQWDDVASNGLSNVICKDGQTTITANIPMSGFKLTGLGAATAAGDALSYSTSSDVTFTDQSGAGLTFSSVLGKSFQAGPFMMVTGQLAYPVTADGSAAIIGGLPAACLNVSRGAAGAFAITAETTGNVVFGRLVQNTTTFEIVNVSGAAVTNATLSASPVRFQFIYPVA